MMKLYTLSRVVTLSDDLKIVNEWCRKFNACAHPFTPHTFEDNVHERQTLATA
jgi:hypothetical protein